MEPQHRDILRRNRVYLKDNLIMVNFIDHVAVLLTSDMEETINANPTNHQQVVCFLDILERRGKDAFQTFLDALEEAQFDHVKRHLTKQVIDEDCVDGSDDVDGPIRQETENDWRLSDLHEEQRQAVISERAMTFVAREVDDVMRVGKIMGFAEGRLRQFQSSSPMPATQISSMFSAWRSKMGSQATVEAFVTLMRDADVDKEHVRTVITKEYPSNDTEA